MSSPSHFRFLVAGLVTLCSLPGGSAWSQASRARSAPLVEAGAAVEVRPRSAPPLIRGSKSAAAPLVELGAAREVAAAELEAIALWNRSGRKPARNGFSRTLPAPREVRFGVELWNRGAGAHAGGLFEKQADGALAWETDVRVGGAYRARLHLAQVELPEGALLWLSGGGETVGPFGLELRDPQGGLWTPSVAGENLRLVVKVPAGTLAEAGFVVDQVMEILGADSVGPGDFGLIFHEKDGECLVNAQCVDTSDFDVVDLALRTVAHLEFVDSCPSGIPGSCGYVCSGGLLNSFGDGEVSIPFFLTANHCFSTQKAAASLEAFFDFFSPSCGGPAPTLGSLPRTAGSTLLASEASSDVTLVRLSSLPAGRFLLGWTNAPVPNGTVLHRLANPCDPNVISGCRPLPQQYSRNRVDISALTCQGVSRPSFIYETYSPNQGDQGATYGGSSGAPVLLDGGIVVGQLTGGCGTNPQDGCDYESNAEVDGAFAASYPALAKFIDPQPTSCIENSTTLCLVGGRFKVSLDFRTQQGLEGHAQAADAGTDNSGLFYFTNPANWEMLVKVLDGCPVNGSKWLFYAATTNVDFTLTVVDTQTGEFKAYTNPLGQAAAPVQDTGAFATCP